MLIYIYRSTRLLLRRRLSFFPGGGGNQGHIITYYVNADIIRETNRKMFHSNVSSRIHFTITKNPQLTLWKMKDIKPGEGVFGGGWVEV